MKNKSHYLLILLTIIFLSFPFICFSELKTVQGEYCDVYLGDLKNKKELDQFRKTVKTKSIENGLYKNLPDTLNVFTPDMCISHVINNYLEKVVFVSHTEKGRKICDKVKITLDPEVINKYLSQDICVVQYERDWGHEIDNVLTKKSDKINIGLIIEIKIKDIEGNKREQLENEEEQHFFYMIEIKRDKYKLVDRRHLKNILEEQKFSMTGLTDSETVKLGKLLNLDIIVLRLIYENSKVTKVLRVDTGEVLLFKTYQTEKEEGWVYYGKSEYGEFYYRNNTTINVSPKIIRVWDKYKYSKIGRDEYIRIIKDSGLPTDSYGKIDYVINLYELDCVNNTRKLMKNVEYNNEGNILQDFDVPHPKIVQIIPGEMVELLLKTVCK